MVAIDESRVLEGLLWVGTDDGLVQVTEDGGKNWRRIETFPGIPKWTYVSDVHASPRDANTVFVTFNNWQRGDYAPYIVKSTDRGRTWVNITANLPAKHDVWAIAQDYLDGDLLFVGHGVRAVHQRGRRQAIRADQGRHAGHQVRDLTLHKRESDVVMATFGRGFFVLDDSARCARSRRKHCANRRDCSRCACVLFVPAASRRPGSGSRPSGNLQHPNPPVGAWITYNVKDSCPLTRNWSSRSPTTAASRCVVASSIGARDCVAWCGT